MDETDSQVERGIRRFLEDLRRSERRGKRERRSAERRVIDLPVEQERRRGRDRRDVGERRSQTDRRAPLAAQFSWSHTMQIQAMMARPSKGVACPRCGGSLLLGPPEVRAGVTTREVLCTGCRRSAAIVEDT